MAQGTRERIIKVAHDLFYLDGFHAVGLDRILDAVRVTKTTFYNHFDSKDELILEVLNWHDKWWRDHFARMLREHGGDSARGQLLAIGMALEEMFTQSEYNGCIFVNVAVTFPLHHDPAHQAAARHKQAMEDIIRELAAFAGIADPRTFAQEYCLIVEGAYVTRQVAGNEETSVIADRLVRLLIDKYLPVKAA